MAAETIKEFLVGIKYAQDQTSLRNFRRTLAGVTKEIAAVGIGAGLGLAGFIAALNKTADALANVYYQAQLAATSGTKLMQLKYAGDQVNNLGDAMVNLAKGIAEQRRATNLGGGPNAPSAYDTYLKLLGVTAEHTTDSVESLKDIVQQYKKIIDSGGSTTQENAILKQAGIDPDTIFLLARNWPAFNKGLEDFKKIAHSAGFNNISGALKAAVEYQRQWNALWEYFALAWYKFASEFMPDVMRIFQTLAGEIDKHQADIHSFFNGLDGYLKELGTDDNIKAFGRELEDVLHLVGEIGKGIAAIASWQSPLTKQGNKSWWKDPDQSQYPDSERPSEAAPRTGVPPSGHNGVNKWDPTGQGGWLPAWRRLFNITPKVYPQDGAAQPVPAPSQGNQHSSNPYQGLRPEGFIPSAYHPGGEGSRRWPSSEPESESGRGLWRRFYDWLQGVSSYIPWVRVKSDTDNQQAMLNAVMEAIAKIPGNFGEPSPDMPTSAEQKKSLSDAVQFFVSKGMTQEQAEGIVARLARESGGNYLDPNAVNPVSGAYGIAQWLGPRKGAALATKGDLRKQLALVWNELTSTEQGALQNIRAAKTPQDAATAMESYERAGDPAFTQAAAAFAKKLQDAVNSPGHPLHSITHAHHASGHLASPSPVGLPPLSASGGTNITMTPNTTIHLHGTGPEIGARVMAAQERVNANLVRNLHAAAI